MRKPELDNRWRLIERWMQYEGELRVALLRVGLVASCYSAQLLHYIVFSVRTEADQQFHRQATYLAAAWLFVSLAALVLLTRQWLPGWLKYCMQVSDLGLLTFIAALGSGPQSPLVLFYFVTIGLAGLRGNLPLVWVGALGSMVGYQLLVALQDPVWFDVLHTTAPIEQIMTQLSLAATGIAVGQFVRMQRQAASAFFGNRSDDEVHS